MGYTNDSACYRWLPFIHVWWGGRRKSTFISNLLLYMLGLHIFIVLKRAMVTYTKSNHHQKRRKNKSLFISQCSCHNRYIDSNLNSSILFFIRQSCSTFEKLVFIYEIQQLLLIQLLHQFSRLYQCFCLNHCLPSSGMVISFKGYLPSGLFLGFVAETYDSSDSKHDPTFLYELASETKSSLCSDHNQIILPVQTI